MGVTNTPFLRPKMKIVWKNLHDIWVSKFDHSFPTTPWAMELHKSKFYNTHRHRTSPWRHTHRIYVFPMKRVRLSDRFLKGCQHDMNREWLHFMKLEGYQKLEIFIFFVSMSQDEWKMYPGWKDEVSNYLERRERTVGRSYLLSSFSPIIIIRIRVHYGTRIQRIFDFSKKMRPDPQINFWVSEHVPRCIERFKS